MQDKVMDIRNLKQIQSSPIQSSPVQFFLRLTFRAHDS